MSPSPARGRRAALRRLTAFILAGAAGGIGVVFGKGNGSRQSACVDLAALSPAARRQRELDNYTERSSNPRETCSGCRFFTAGAGRAACGQCQIFDGPANPKGRCDDWMARPA